MASRKVLTLPPLLIFFFLINEMVTILSLARLQIVGLYWAQGPNKGHRAEKSQTNATKRQQRCRAQTKQICAAELKKIQPDSCADA